MQYLCQLEKQTFCNGDLILNDLPRNTILIKVAKIQSCDLSVCHEFTLQQIITE